MEWLSHPQHRILREQNRRMNALVSTAVTAAIPFTKELATRCKTDIKRRAQQCVEFRRYARGNLARVGPAESLSTATWQRLHCQPCWLR